MPLYITRRAGESFSVRDSQGLNVVRVTVAATGDEPLLAIEAPKHLRIFREDRATPIGGIEGPGVRDTTA